MSVEIDGLTYVVATDDEGVARNIFLRSSRPEFIVLPRALRLLGPDAARGCFVDVGANIGTTTIPAVARHGFDTAVACEPSPSNTPLLRANCALNGVADRVRIVEAAVSAARGTLEFDVSKTPGRHKVAAAGAGATLTVPAVSLDALAADGVLTPADVGLLWIDAQGHEPEVLTGASSLLGRRVPVVTAIRRHKLARTGTADALASLFESYDTFVDLREPHLDEAGWEPTLRPAATLREWLHESPKTTDVVIY